MKTTIDRAGRVVIPATIRSQADLKPGTELEVVLENGDIRLVKRVSRPKLVRVGKRLVARPSMPAGKLPHVDIADVLEKERERWPH